jgi:TRAP-type mannitol/chloroaromatic compound transport system substrate-binding protein
MVEKHNVALKRFPADFVAAARKEAADVLGGVAAHGEIARRVHESYVAFRARTTPWSRISLRAVLEGREG